MASIAALEGQLILLNREYAEIQDAIEIAAESGNENNLRILRARELNILAQITAVQNQINSLSQPGVTEVFTPGPEADIVIIIPDDEEPVLPGQTGGYGFGDTTEPPGSGRVLEEVGEDDPIFPGGGAGIGVGEGNGNAQGAGINPFGSGVDAADQGIPLFGPREVDDEDAPIVAPIAKPQNPGETYYDEDADELDFTPEEPIDDTGIGELQAEVVPQSPPTGQSVNGQTRDTQLQASIRETRQPASDGDWRVRLSLAPGATYLYNDPGNLLMRPLVATKGVLFPYTPQIDVAYLAEYTKYRPTHSNYQHYFYQGSSVGEVNLTCTFTAQDSAEADYLLAAITFFKAASKMFYGQDPQRGSPPPLLRFTGLGQYQFNEHPVVISQFNYNLPRDVDYIRAGANLVNSQLGLQSRRSRSGGPQWAGSTLRLLMNNLNFGGRTDTETGPTTLRANGQIPSYVPTKIEINMQLLPVVTRQDNSQLFSLSNYARGNLLRGGFW